MSTNHSCTHIKVNGLRCGSPALRGEQFCYYHQRALRGVRTPPSSRLHPIALIEDPQSIQFTLMEVINAILRDTIDLKRATLILRALHIAVKNMQNPNYVRTAELVRIDDGKTIREVPDYADEADSSAGSDAHSARHACDIPLTAAYPPAVDAVSYRKRHDEPRAERETEAAILLKLRNAASSLHKSRTPLSETVHNLPTPSVPSADKPNGIAHAFPQPASPSSPDASTPTLTPRKPAASAPPPAVAQRIAKSRAPGKSMR